MLLALFTPRLFWLFINQNNRFEYQMSTLNFSSVVKIKHSSVLIYLKYINNPQKVNSPLKIENIAIVSFLYRHTCIKR